jgi:hypothetical protein
LFGREINLPFDISVIPKQHLSSDAKQQLEEVLANLKITQDLATKNMKLRQAKAKDRYDRNLKKYHNFDLEIWFYFGNMWYPN